MGSMRKDRLETGAAAISVELRRGELRVRHMDTGEVLLARKVCMGFWVHELWAVLRNGGRVPVTVRAQRGRVEIKGVA